LLAAALFGISTPLVQQFGVGLWAFSTAALLYSGAAAVGLLSRQPAEREAWWVDNALSRALAERDPGQVVMVKALLGTTATVLLAVALGEPLPSSAGAALALSAIGATGYGLSLRFFLLAQGVFGAVRTGSVFAFAPFIGAALAVALGDRSISPLMAIGSVLMLADVVLHLAQSHGHQHVHQELEHEHAHRHDDGHQSHVHDQTPTSEHSHRHRHAPLRHRHAHVPDAHHGHRHGARARPR